MSLPYFFVESGSFRVPEVLILDSCKITSAGHTEDLNRLCSQVTELDLTDNSITNWSEIGRASCKERV